MHLLVVDDEPEAQRSVLRILKACGAEVITADSVEHATRIIHDSPPFDAAVVDYQLLNQTGLSIISRLRSGTRPCCALMITGDPDEDRGIEAIAAGADDFLVKPVVAKDLIEAVMRTINQTRQWRARLSTKFASGHPRGVSAVRDAEGVDIGVLEFETIVGELCRLGELTYRERQVLEQILLGKTNRDAGAAIGLTERTVKYHMAGILKKVGVRSRNELIRFIFSRRNEQRPEPN